VRSKGVKKKEIMKVKVFERCGGNVPKRWTRTEDAAARYNIGKRFRVAHLERSACGAKRSCADTMRRAVSMKSVVCNLRLSVLRHCQYRVGW